MMFGSQKFGILILITSIFLSCRFKGESVVTEENLGASGTEFNLVVAHTNDTHGHPLAFDDLPQKSVGGLPARKTLVEQIRRNSENFLLLDAGDFNTGMPESSMFKAEPDIVGFNELGYDAVVLGNHEFDNPPDVLATQIASAKFPFLAANLYGKDGNLLVKPYIIKEMNGCRVGIFGLITTQTKELGVAANISGLRFEDEVETAKAMVEKLRIVEKADVVIALTHLGIYGAGKGSRRIAENVKGINLIVDGHSHTKMTKPMSVNGTGIVQAWQNGAMLGVARLIVKDGSTTSLKWEAIPINLQNKNSPDEFGNLPFLQKKIEEDAALLKILSTYSVRAKESISEQVGVSEDAFLSKESRGHETQLGQIVVDSVKAAAAQLGAEFALIAAGTIRGSLQVGPITKRSVYEVVPFDNSVVVLTLTGTDIKDLCTFSATTRSQSSYALLSDGVEMRINYKNAKCEAVSIGGKPLEFEKTYRVATNSYLATGGDGYEVFKRGTNVVDTSIYMREALSEYIKQKGGVLRSFKVQNRIISVN